MTTMRIPRSKAVAILLALLMALGGTAQPVLAHDFGGGTGPGGPPPPDGCPGCCGGGGGGGDPCDGSGPGCGSSGGPVNFWDGAERHTTQDVLIAGYIPISFSRIYDSRIDYDSPVGYGWAHSYDMRLFQFPDGTVMIRRDGGGRREFVPSGGSFISPAGEFRNELIDDGDGTYTLIEDDGFEYAFDLRGRLESIQDVHGNRLEMEYDPAGRLPLMGVSKWSPRPENLGVISLDYRLTAVRERDAQGTLTGRSISLTYDGTTGRLQSVTDHTSRVWTYSHDLKGNLSSVSRSPGLVYTYEYEDANDPHNLTRLDELKQSFTLTYDAADRVTQQAFDTGTTLDIVYDMPGLMTTVTETVRDQADVVVSTAQMVYEFNEFGNPTAITDKLGHRSVLVRDSEGMTTRREFYENIPETGLTLMRTIDFTLDANGNVMTHVSTDVLTGESVTRNYTYTANKVASLREFSSNDPTFVTGYDHDWAVNGRGYPTFVTQERRIISGGNTPTPTFFVTDYGYNAFGQLTTTTYPGGDVETIGYTNSYVTNMNGETMTRDARGNLLTRTDRNNETWTYVYDDFDRAVTVTDAEGAITRLTWNRLDMVQTEIGATGSTAGQINTFEYDDAGRLTAIRQQLPGGGDFLVGSMTVDSEGRILTRTDADGRTITYSYDVMGRMTSISNPGFGTRTFDYDMFGNRISDTDAMGRQINFSFRNVDSPGKSLTATNGISKTYTAALDVLGNLKTLTDPNGRTLTETHDAMGRITAFQTPSTATTAFNYNSRGLLGSRTDPRGVLTQYSYNARGELTGVDYASGSETVTITRDPQGQITRVVDADSDLSFTYDGTGRITRETNNLTGRWVNYTFDSRGRRETMTTSDGQSVNYTYDQFGYLRSIVRNGDTEVTHSTSPTGLVSQSVYGDGRTLTYTYNDAGKIVSQVARDGSNTLLSQTDYTRDASGLIVLRHEIQQQPSGPTTELYIHYTYDDGLRLMREEIRDADNVTVLEARTFDYDDVGNRTQMAFDGGPTTTYAYGPDYELLTETTGGASIAYTYDAAGGLQTETASGTTVTYSRDFEGRLIGFTSPSVNVAYALSFDGRRLAKTSGGNTTDYLYDGMNVVGEYQAASPTVRYLSGLKLDEWILREESGQKSYTTLLQDMMSVMQVTDSAGAVQNSYIYKAFGESFSQQTNTPNVLTFTGRRDEAETDHTYFRERLYSKRTGRFLSLDPYRPDAARTTRIGRPDRFALRGDGVQNSPLFSARRNVNVTGMDVTGYQYVGNNPVNATDPTGEVLIWNPASGSVTSGCVGSACLLTGCLGSGCGGSACGGSGCGGSGCVASGCGGSGCVASVCGGSGCVGSGCGVSVCVNSACGYSICTFSGCVMSKCGGSACAGSQCGASGCVVSICVGSGCMVSVCALSACGASGCTSSGCQGSASCSQSGCSGSACNAASGCNSPCC